MDQHFRKEQISEWYSSYSNDIYNYVFFLIGDHELAKDILQDTFIKAYSNLETFQGENARGWLFRIARNLTIDFIRKKKPITYLTDSFAILKENAPTPEQMAVLNESEKELYMALGKLKRSYRDVIILRKIKEFSIKETAQILEWTENKVKVQLFRGLSALRKQLEKEDYRHETVRFR
ncbi:RNA polymerase sigma factor [Paucisalibacillus sp. EB02]|uniref:RNA polymerase sigma factor n=1 Tax=Paucisalibacillus sp. EB02 TaxID=1347087 RepID=UPI0004B50CB9|nr:RNA polymerase sigma factor [Paucisalibacillus sp. EB02]